MTTGSYTYSPERARLIGSILGGSPPVIARAYDLLDTRYRVQSLHQLTDEQLRELVAWARYLTALSDARASIPDPYRCDPSDPSDPAALIERCFAALSEAEQALMQYREAVEAEARS